MQNLAPDDKQEVLYAIDDRIKKINSYKAIGEGLPKHFCDSLERCKKIKGDLVKLIERDVLKEKAKG